MTIKDIRPEEDVREVLDDVAKTDQKISGPTLWRHRKKDGTLIDDEITADEITFDGRTARRVMAFDITERKRAENERSIVFEIIQGIVTTPNLDEFLKLVHRSISQIV